jgi:DMSO/TMAO reductase YedYZ molybdopterin-dependent catalytic subunit
MSSKQNVWWHMREYGVPLRLRVENQLGCKMYKMVKWIERIEFIESEKAIGKGER